MYKICPWTFNGFFLLTRSWNYKINKISYLVSFKLAFNVSKGFWRALSLIKYQWYYIIDTVSFKIIIQIIFQWKKNFYSLSFLVCCVFFMPPKLTNQGQLFWILINHGRVFLRNKNKNEKNQAVDIKCSSIWGDNSEDEVNRIQKNYRSHINN